MRAYLERQMHDKADAKALAQRNEKDRELATSGMPIPGLPLESKCAV